ncbi:ATP-dependent DNA helicase PIF1-like protein [Tanacetum coccineum]
MLTNLENRLLREALTFDANKSKVEHEKLHSMLNPEQRLIYEQIIESMHNDIGKFCFIHGPGGTGKTFLYKTIIARLRSEQMIVLAVASSGIASLLLPAGRTTHSRFVIPLELMENSTCGIKQNTHLAELMHHVRLIIWDEQILPVIPNAKRPEVIQACINQSELWKYYKVFTLTRIMRVNGYGCNGEIDNRKQDFNRWVLVVGDGKLPAKKKESEDKPTWIEIPEEFLIKSWTSLIEKIIAESYPDFTLRQTDDDYLKEREILTPRNDDADAINENMFKKLGGALVTYNSANEICKASTDTADQHNLYPVEVTSPDGLKILMIEDEDKEFKNDIRNIVFKEAFNNVS